MKFIYLCAAIVILSFTAVPAFFGVSEERAIILASNDNVAPQTNDQSLSFDEIYEIAAQGSEDEFTPEALNNMTPAAGEQSDSFPSGFSGVSDAALTDEPPQDRE